jgi:hypothetical protein
MVLNILLNLFLELSSGGIIKSVGFTETSRHLPHILSLTNGKMNDSLLFINYENSYFPVAIVTSTSISGFY